MSRNVGVACALAILLLGSGVRAQGNDPAAARELFRVGQEDMRQGRVDAACEKFAEAQRLDPNVGYLVNLARCDEKRDRLADARESWEKALDLAKLRGDTRLADVRAGYEAVDKQVPRIIVQTTAAPPDGLVLRRDDVVLTSASLGVPLPVNPGKHVIAATAPGRKAWSKEISVRGGDRVVTIEVPELTAQTEAPAGPASAPAGGVSLEPSRPAGGTQRTLGVITAALGVAAAGVGTFFTLRASSLNEDSKALCDPAAPNSCSSEGVTTRDDALAAADVATVSFVAAGVLVVGGAVLFLTAPSRSKSATTSFLGSGFVHRF